MLVIKSGCRNYEVIFDYDNKRNRLITIDQELADPKNWHDQPKIQALNKERKVLQDALVEFDKLANDLQNTHDLLLLAKDENDQATIEEIFKDLSNYEEQITNLEFRRMFSGKMDANNAYLDIQSGAGGTEAQDWAEMLLRMYLRWGERHEFKTELLEVSAGEVAGIKSATVKFTGEYAYGWLRTETGIHRLVRKSPFNADNKRHTSFASVFVYPEVDEEIEIEINPADLRIDTYRASGAGGQHVNRTDSAVRITHLPTKIVVQCQSDRSQHRNKAEAMKQLKAKLYDLELKEKYREHEKLAETKREIAWGNQIRSYVLDESRIKDLRTGVEIHNTKSVLDGDIDKFIQASLMFNA